MSRPAISRRAAITAAAGLIASAALLAGCVARPWTTEPVGSAVPSLATAPKSTTDATLQLPEPASGRIRKTTRYADRDMVAAANPLAVDAGVAVLARGGSAVDAAIAVQMVLNLVEPQSSGIGGGGFLLHYDRGSDRLLAYDGRETAPAQATPDMLLGRDGQPMTKSEAIDGGLSVGTPGLVRMLELAHRSHGRIAWAELFAPAIRLAEDGFPVSPRLSASIAASAARLCAQPPANAYFLRPGTCEAKPAGTRLVNPEFAATLRAIARSGADALHRGPIARAIIDKVRSHPARPGRLALADLEGYRAVVREPVCGPYRSFRICGMPPPSSGGVAVLQALGILEAFDLRALPEGSADAVHLVSEAYRLAYADRARHLADPDQVPIPIAGLLDAAYLRQRATLIRMDRTIGVPPAGAPAGALVLGDDRSATLPSTTHVSIVDADGNAVSMTTSIENGFGSLQMVGGFLLNNQLTDFAFAPSDAAGRPLANRVEPGKRPRSTMAPTMVFGADGQLEAILGSPGGVAIVPYVTKTLIGLIDRGMDIQQAIDAPNFVAETTPSTWIERDTPLTALAPELRARGHRVTVFDLNSGVQGIVFNGDRSPAAGAASLSRVPGAGRWAGGADSRREGVARGNGGRGTGAWGNGAQGGTATEMTTK